MEWGDSINPLIGKIILAIHMNMEPDGNGRPLEPPQERFPLFSFRRIDNLLGPEQVIVTNDVVLNKPPATIGNKLHFPCFLLHDMIVLIKRVVPRFVRKVLISASIGLSSLNFR